MANAEHLRKLKEGVEEWTKWQAKNPEIELDLSKANLSKANLSGADLSGADLIGAKLNGANLSGADLSWAALCGANLCGTNLSGASLFEANLLIADLSDANLSGADLTGAKLSGADLDNTSFSNAILDGTIIAFTSLKTAKGLETCVHHRPSILDYSALMDSGPLPEVFLRGCGLSVDYISYLPSFWNTPIQFYSCFISYSHADKSFARRLHDALQGRGIRCWLDEHQLLPGDDLYEGIDRGVRLWDKLLLCASKASLTSWWVDGEINRAFQKEAQMMKERGKKVLVLIPLNLDGFLFDADYNSGKKAEITSRLAANFNGWDKNNAKFEKQLELVIKALRADAGVRELAPKPRL
jgi:hypothetical protein